MAKNVYVLPAFLRSSTKIHHPYRVQTEVNFDGGLIQQTELEPRFRADISGPIHPNNRVSFETYVDRISGGIGLTALWDQSLRKALGWDGRPAIHTNGTQYWRASGATGTYNNETSSPWRAVTVTGSGSSGSTSLSLTGLLASEPIAAGAPIKIGNYRHIIATATTANGSGAATVTLARPLRAAISGNVDLPGDLFVADLEDMDAPNFDILGVADFKASYRQVYWSEVSGGFTWVV